MIHPSTALRFIDADVGYGVFATAPLPKGTITYAWDPLEVEIGPGDSRLDDPALGPLIERYSYIDARGVRIVSWDHAKYVNHCCQCNTMSTAYGFEIAIRDIDAEEQITDEYGMFNLREPMKLLCSRSPCRGSVCGTDLGAFAREWDEQVKSALRLIHLVDQPLWGLIEPRTATEVERFVSWGEGYRSVGELGEAVRSRRVRSSRKGKTAT